MNNKHGWGLNEMLIFSSIIVGFLLIAVLCVHNLYSGVEQMNQHIEEEKGFSYKEVEANLKSAAKKYYEEIEESEIITSEDVLNQKYITEERLTPKKELQSCTGYVIVENGKLFTPFISCDKYETEGY